MIFCHYIFLLLISFMQQFLVSPIHPIIWYLFIDRIVIQYCIVLVQYFLGMANLLYGAVFILVWNKVMCIKCFSWLAVDKQRMFFKVHLTSHMCVCCSGGESFSFSYEFVIRPFSGSHSRSLVVHQCHTRDIYVTHVTFPSLINNCKCYSKQEHWFKVRM